MSKEAITQFSDQQERNVVEHNSLINSVAKMDKVPLKIFEMAVSMIDTKNPPKDNTILLSKKELFALFKATDNDKQRRFKHAIEMMQKQAYFRIREVKKKGFEYESIVPIPYVKWNDYRDDVTVEFNQHIMPYLIDLKENFTQYALSDVVDLESKYSIIIYKWLSMNYNQYDYYSHQGNRTKKQLELLKNPYISLEDLREITDTQEQYARMQDFTRWVLEKPTQEISTHTHFKLTYEKVKYGRKVVGVKFYLSEKVVASQDYKQGDLVTQQQTERRKRETQELAVEAIQSKYTQSLLKYGLLNGYEMTNVDTMVGLQKHVYTKYALMEKKLDYSTVDKHLHYVSEKAIDFSKKNIAKYLEKSAEDYLIKLRIQEKEAELK